MVIPPRKLLALGLCLALMAATAPAWAQDPPRRPDLYVVAIGLPTPDPEGAHGRPCPLRPPGIEIHGEGSWPQACEALAVAGAAAEQGGRLYGEVHALAWIDTASPQALLRDVAAFLAPAGQADRILVYLRGLGAADLATGRYAFFTAPTEASPLPSLDQGALLKILAAAGPREGLVFVDSFDPGAFTALRAAHPGLGRAVVVGDPLPLERFVGPSPSGDGDDDAPQALAARRPSLGGWGQVAAGPSRGGAPQTGPGGAACEGPLCVALVEILSAAPLSLPEGLAGDRPDVDFLLSAAELAEVVSARLAALTGYEQRPTFSGALMSDTEPWLWTSGGRAPCQSQGDLCLEVVCNGVDDDGDGRVDEGFDEDGDGAWSDLYCAHRVTPLDCDDADPLVSYDAPEVSNLVDDDCDGRIDETAGDVSPANGYSDAYDARVKARQRQLYSTLGLSSAAVAVATGTILYNRLRVQAAQAGGTSNVTGVATGVVSRSWFAVTAAGAAGVGFGLCIPLRGRLRALEGERERYRVSPGGGSDEE